MKKTTFLSADYFEAYSQALPVNMLELVQEKVTKSEYSVSDFEYYKTIHIGIDYYNLDMVRCLPFLLLLPQSLEE
jgi:hypothetical protein